MTGFKIPWNKNKKSCLGLFSSAFATQNLQEISLLKFYIRKGVGSSSLADKAVESFPTLLCQPMWQLLTNVATADLVEPTDTCRICRLRIV